MKWTKKKPEKPGWYWAKHPRWDMRLAMILEIEKNDCPLEGRGEKEGELIINLATGNAWLEDSAHVGLETGKGYNSHLDNVAIEDIDEWIWAGPIEEPGPMEESG